MKSLQKKIYIIERTIKIIELEFGTKVCKDINLHCINCQSQILLGLLKDYQSNLSWELKAKVI